VNDTLPETAGRSGARTCPGCGAPVSESDRFCRACGCDLRSDHAAIDSYLAKAVPARVDAILGERLKDQKVVEVETAELLAERAIKWLRTIGFLLGIPAVLFGALLSFVGFTTYSQLQQAADRVTVLKAEIAGLESQLGDPKQQLSRVNQELAGIQRELGSAKTQLAKVDERQGSLEQQLTSIRGRLDFCPAKGLSIQIKEKLQDGLSRFIAYLQEVGFQGLDDHVAVCIYSRDDPIQNPRYASASESTNAFYAENALYIHQAMTSDLTVALIQYAHHALLRRAGSPQFQSDVMYGLSDYFVASFTGKPEIGAGLGTLLGLPTPYVRNIDNALAYAAVPDEVHQHGAVWGGALWSCRQAQGAPAVDRVALGAWQAVAGSATAADTAKRFGAALAASGGDARQCLTQEINRRGLPH
jgi:hypothetical protein